MYFLDALNQHVLNAISLELGRGARRNDFVNLQFRESSTSSNTFNPDLLPAIRNKINLHQ
ncbi:unnamed protein product [Clonostachys rosea f. rosea IK726]|uniref:Uncharacterized protein n=1 Tax=Clonostachys rosea f. rosea IK726 TaxID=1349383 RepID=A0ACA9U2S9_BIOOC|nr:unnamed protein product [Clonostachys rosea f. rosea IK726]